MARRRAEELDSLKDDLKKLISEMVTQRSTGTEKKHLDMHVRCLRILERLEPVECKDWIPIEERLPERDLVWCKDFVLVSLENYPVPAIGHWRVDSKTGDGAFYTVDFSGRKPRTFASIDLFVNAWMPLPECYKEDK